MTMTKTEAAHVRDVVSLLASVRYATQAPGSYASAAVELDAAASSVLGQEPVLPESWRRRAEAYQADQDEAARYAAFQDAEAARLADEAAQAEAAAKAEAEAAAKAGGDGK